MKKILIVGGGSGGLSSAAKLASEKPEWKIIIVEPSEFHYYQPLWTLVGGGVSKKEETKRMTKDFIPEGAEWVKDSVEKFNPENNTVVLKSGEELSYDYLIVSPGIQIDWDHIEGLKEAMGKNGVCSNYSFETVDFTFEAIKNTKQGNALFTYPNTPIKCGGAPQKIMYLAEEYFRDQKLRSQINVEFVSAGAGIFAVQKYKTALEGVINSREINTTYGHNLVKIDGDQQIAYFENLETKEVIEKKFSMIHVTPPMSSPDFIKNSPLSADSGWVDVNKETLQHNKFPNVFSLGDASSLPTSKTGAAIRKQYPVLVKNLIAFDDNKSLDAQYDGYTSCPLVTGKGKLILAEFDYDGNPAETFPFDQSKERLSMYLLKKYILPLLYWFGMIKGRM